MKTQLKGSTNALSDIKYWDSAETNSKITISPSFKLVEISKIQIKSFSITKRQTGKLLRHNAQIRIGTSKIRMKTILKRKIKKYGMLSEREFVKLINKLKARKRFKFDLKQLMKTKAS